MQWRLTSSTTAIVDMTTNVTATAGAAATAALCGAAKRSRVNLAAEESRKHQPFFRSDHLSASKAHEGGRQQQALFRADEAAILARQNTARAPLPSPPPPYPTGD